MTKQQMREPVRTGFGRALRVWRERQGWTQQRLSEYLGLSFTTVNRWEVRGRYPLPIVQAKLRALGYEGPFKDGEEV